jgi:hypothetical protein
LRPLTQLTGSALAGCSANTTSASAAPMCESPILRDNPKYNPHANS